MIVYRITKERYPNPLDATGAATHGARFNSRGIDLLYFAQTESLARLEALADVILTRNVVRLLHQVEVPDKAIATPSSLGLSLPPHWDGVPPGAATRTFGDAWIKSLRSLALFVPSVQSSTERNILINPNHEHFERVRVRDSVRIRFDSRHVPRQPR